LFKNLTHFFKKTYNINDTKHIYKNAMINACGSAFSNAE